MNPRAPWRRRLSELGRNVGKPHAPLFAPLLYGVASQIEALPPAEVTADPTRLCKCLVELRRVLGTTPLTVAAPSGMEAEALGAQVDRSTWPPRVTAPAADAVIAMTGFDEAWSRSEALSASLETCRRLSASLSGEPVLLAGLTGPATLLAEVWEGSATAEAYEFAGRALAALSRQFAQAGAGALLICERVLPAGVEDWSAALATLSNIARFHRLPALLAFDEGLASTPACPATLVACPAQPDPDAARAQGLRVGADPASWEDLPDRAARVRVVVTAREVAADSDLDALTDACERALEIEREG